MEQFPYRNLLNALGSEEKCRIVQVTPGNSFFLNCRLSNHISTKFISDDFFDNKQAFFKRNITETDA